MNAIYGIRIIIWFNAYYYGFPLYITVIFRCISRFSAILIVSRVTSFTTKIPHCQYQLSLILMHGSLQYSLFEYILCNKSPHCQRRNFIWHAFQRTTLSKPLKQVSDTISHYRNQPFLWKTPLVAQESFNDQYIYKHNINTHNIKSHLSCCCKSPLFGQKSFYTPKLFGI